MAYCAVLLLFPLPGQRWLVAFWHTWAVFRGLENVKRSLHFSANTCCAPSHPFEHSKARLDNFHQSSCFYLWICLQGRGVMIKGYLNWNCTTVISPDTIFNNLCYWAVFGIFFAFCGSWSDRSGYCKCLLPFIYLFFWPWRLRYEIKSCVVFPVSLVFYNVRLFLLLH